LLVVVAAGHHNLVVAVPEALEQIFQDTHLQQIIHHL
jgi:hypothetical protein